MIRHYSIILNFFILSLIILLSSCSHTKRGDGPPNFYVDETKIPNAVPKKERLSKYGNMHSYVVKGRRYYPMHSSRNYEAVGTASWYGTLFHAKRTSSGERYNMLSMTAAHKTLPLPTYVEVTNLKNKRKIIVKVNDRGPFKSNRLIDLSYVAAKKLGMIGHGTALVKVKAIDPGHSDWHFPWVFAHRPTMHPLPNRPLYHRTVATKYAAKRNSDVRPVKQRKLLVVHTKKIKKYTHKHPSILQHSKRLVRND